MRGWKRKGRGESVRLSATLDSHEAELIESLTRSMIELLDERAGSAPRDDLSDITGIQTGHSSPPSDATLGRLLPDFHRPEQDEQMNVGDVNSDLNAALRSIHEPHIIAAKIAAGSVVLSTIPTGGGQVNLTQEQARSWLSAINDIRLALAAMLGVTDSTPDELSPGHPNAAHLDVYQWLTVVQEMLLVALMGKAN